MTTNTLSSLMNTFLLISPFRHRIMEMLRPMDIISLVTASGVKLSTVERNKYFSIWRQMFYDMHWVTTLEEMDCTVTIIGYDLRRLHTALHRGDSSVDLSLLKTVVVIGEPTLSRPYDHKAIISRSFDTTVEWHRVPQDPARQPYKIDQTAHDVQTCVLSIPQCSSAELDCTWSKILSKQHGSLAQFLVGPGKPYPSSFDVWESEWQQLDGVKSTIYKPNHMHYIVEPHQMEFYRTRIIVNSKLVCCALLMRV